MYYLYILKSEKGGHYYTGVTNDLGKRLARHNAGWVTATKSLKPLKIVYYEEYSAPKDARRRERYIKSQKSKIFIDGLINKFSSSGG